MHNLVVLLVLESLQYLNREPSNKALAHTLKIVILYEFIEVDAQALEGDQ
jgi:hypothetical protein